MTWRGRRGAVLLGPTEHRVARWLLEATRAGRITIRTIDLAAAVHVERSEAYRITRRLRTLGLFGIENDQGGTNGGRRYWRTAIEHETGALDAARHRQAWSRVLAWARGATERSRRALELLRGQHMRATTETARSIAVPAPAGGPPASPAGDTFADRMRRSGLGGLMDRWALDGRR